MRMRILGEINEGDKPNIPSAAMNFMRRIANIHMAGL